MNPDRPDLPTSQTSDGLRERLRAGDQTALAALLERCWTPLVGYLSGLLDSRDDAEDVAQMAFVRVWETRRRLARDGSLEAWLYRIARNAALDARKQHTRRLQRQRHGVSSPTLSVDPAEVGELRRAVERAVQALAPRRREVFLLVRHSGLSYRAVADLLHITPQTVANQMTRAMADLRRALAPFLPSTDRAPAPDE